MPSSYPTGLDSLATNKADATVTLTDHPAHHNDLADAVNKIEAELGISPSGSAATVAASIASLGATPVYRLGADASVGATMITLDRAPTLPIIIGTPLLLSAYTTRAELKRVVSISGNTVTVSATTTAHNADDQVMVVTGDNITALMYGGLANGSDEWPMLQRMLIETHSMGLSVQGFNATFHAQQPLMVSGSSRVNNIAIQTRTGYAPVDAAGAAVMVAGNPGLAFTAAASTNVITVPAGHGLTSFDTTNDTKIVFNNPYGEAMPGGITAGQVYYVDTLPTGTTLTVSATPGGSTLDITSDGAGTVYGGVEQLHRLFSESLRINITVAGVNGLRANLQQPSWTRNLRIEMSALSNPNAIGFALTGQISYHDNVLIKGPADLVGTCMQITGTDHVVRGFNCNPCGIGLNIGGDAISIHDPWTENVGIAGIQIAGTARGVKIGGTWLRSAGQDIPALKVITSTNSWQLDLMRNNNAGNALMIEDTARGYEVRSVSGSTGDTDAGGICGPMRQPYGLVPPIFLARDAVGKSADYTVRRIDEIVSVSTAGGNRTITLPTAVGWHGWTTTIGNWAGANNVIVDPTGSQTIAGAATLTLLPGEAVTVFADGVNYQVMSRS